MRGRDNAPRPADVLLASFQDGHDVALDISVTNPLQPALVARVAANPSLPVMERERDKRRKYETQCREAGVIFIPCAVTIYGGWSAGAEKVFDDITRREADEQHISVGRARYLLYAQLSACLAKRNAWAILARKPSRPHPPLPFFP